MALEPTRIRLNVDAAAGERIDAFVARQVATLSRSAVARLIAGGHVRRNGEAVRKSERVEPGDEIDIVVPPPMAAGLEAEDLPLRIVYEDDELLVVDKAAGMVVHPAPGHATGTLVHALLHHVPDLAGIGGVARPGIVHRLDRETSGLMVVAKTERAHRALSAALKRRTVKRYYWVAAWGHLGSDLVTVDAPIGRSATDRKRMAVRPDGRRAVTRFRRLERWVAADLLSAELETGRTHQIRVHLEHIGHPVVGDPLYGGGSARGISGPGRGWAGQLARRVDRQFLHAAELSFSHPTTGEALTFRSPLPADLAAALAWARGQQGSGQAHRLR